MSDNLTVALRTIEDGKVPQCRMADAAATQDFVTRLLFHDSKRSYKRGRVNGLIDGNPPYKLSKLKEAGRADACNVNWGIARSYMESGCGAFYDLFSETPGNVGIRTGHGTPEERSIWSSGMMEEADRILSGDDVFDYNMQQSQWDMVLHGCGPLMFEDAYCVLPKAFHAGDLKVPEFTKSDTHYWDACAVEAVYYPPQLFEFIENADAASKIGWDVGYTKRVIEMAMGLHKQSGIRYDWEFYQQELKNNSLSYYDDAKVCRVAHVFWKEFDGTLTHSIVERQTSTGLKVQYLFQRIGRYQSWQRCLHPMYFDRGNGGYHHSVTGLGVKMFGAMEYQNRLICNLADKAFAPKILFKPTTTESSQKFALSHFGDYAVLPSGFEWNQTGVAGLSNEGIAMNREVTELMRENLSSYRQNPMRREGNPPTARQVMYDASQESSLSKTTFNRYYKQLDLLYAEIVRRLCNANSTDPRAIEFQDRCRKRGIPVEALGRIDKVEAIRVIGQGSAFMRKQSVDSLLPLAGALPEDGRDNLIADKIAAEAGQSAVNRYYPKRMASKMATEQQERAMNQVADMKVGVPPTLVPSQNAAVFATLFMQAATQSFQSLQQGANPLEVLHFLEICGPGIQAHLKRFATDPTRAELFKQLTEQWHRLAALTDQLKQKMQEQAQAQQEQQQKTQQVASDEQLKTAKVQSDIQVKNTKAAAQLKQSEEKHRQKLAHSEQDMQIADAKAASEIRLAKLKAVEAAKAKPAAKTGLK